MQVSIQDFRTVMTESDSAFTYKFYFTGEIISEDPSSH